MEISYIDIRVKLKKLLAWPIHGMRGGSSSAKRAISGAALNLALKHFQAGALKSPTYINGLWNIFAGLLVELLGIELMCSS